jgi:hypothetical protein
LRKKETTLIFILLNPGGLEIEYPITKYLREQILQGKGHAEMAVSRHRPMQSGIATPESMPTTPTRDSCDEENVCKK